MVGIMSLPAPRASPCSPVFSMPIEKRRYRVAVPHRREHARQSQTIATDAWRLIAGGVKPSASVRMLSPGAPSRRRRCGPVLGLWERAIAGAAALYSHTSCES